MWRRAKTGSSVFDQATVVGPLSVLKQMRAQGMGPVRSPGGFDALHLAGLFAVGDEVATVLLHAGVELDGRRLPEHGGAVAAFLTARRPTYR